MDRPTREILKGSEVATLHPEKVGSVNNLITSKSLFVNAGQYMALMRTSSENM